jgi:hypothetical protein
MPTEMHTATKTRTASSQPFWAFQAIFAVALLTFCGWAWNTVNHRLRMPVLNNQPRTIRPTHNIPLVVSDEQLRVVLNKLHPRFDDGPPKTNFVDHALRMWGVDATFNDNSMSGEALRSAMLNQQHFAKNWGVNTAPLLKRSPLGIAVRTQEGRATVSHVDHLLGSLAETGTALDHPIVLDTSSATVKELANHAFQSFRLNQKEYEWTALAWALYADAPSTWYTRENQRVTFAHMANRMMRQPLPDGVCYGQHRLYSLTVMLRVDSQLRAEGKFLLESDCRAEIEKWLGDLTAKLYRNQSIEGYWDGNWPNSKVSVPDPQTDALSRRILATGHTLEWWAMAPKSLHPPRETIVRAGQWLANTIAGMDDESVKRNYTFLTHAGRALALWRAKFPHEFEREQQERDSVGQAQTESQNQTIRR